VRPVAATFGCGPLEVRVEAADGALHAKVAETLGLYDLQWERSDRAVDVSVGWVATPAPLGPGHYLTCARMRVDAIAGGLRATTMRGATATGCFTADSERWCVQVPADVSGPELLADVEDIIGLVVTSGWRRAGWVPMHAAAVARDRSCALLCAPSGGGKSTLTAALVRRGWRALGDDKLLLRTDADERPYLAAVLQTFNLDPDVRSWMPEVGDLERLPRYSVWTQKRKVRLADVWPEALVCEASPTHLVVIRRTRVIDRVRLEPLPPAAVFSTLLRQTVVPGDGRAAAPILRTVAATAQCLKGLQVHLPEGIFADPSALEELEASLRDS
jgi:hypothetical protein